MPTKLPKNYKPLKSEKFMNAKQKEYFRLKLENWKNDIFKESKETVENLQDSIAPADISDRATQESEKTLELRTRDRQRKLISKIDAALNRIENSAIKELVLTDSIEALKEFGLVKGTFMSLKRILSCHPIKFLGGGDGFDPVKKEVKAKK